MKKIWKVATLIGMVAIAFGATGLAFAQTESPQPYNNPGYDQGMRGGRGRDGSGMAYGEVGSDHDIMIGNFAEALGITIDQLEVRLEDGETMWEIIEAEGASWEEFTAIMQLARTSMQEQAVEDGTMNQEQANFMNSQPQGRVFEREYEDCMGYDYSDLQGPQGRWNAP